MASRSARFTSARSTSARCGSAPFAPDRDVPGPIVRIGSYPLHHGGVGAIRSLGRLGVPMYAVTEDRWTPAALSRYLERAFVRPTTGTEEPERFVEGLLRIGRRMQRELSADHVMAATGYRTVVAALGFLGPGVRTALAVTRGAPRLDAGYGSSVPGLYFTGLPAAASFGPVVRFVCGTEYVSPRLARAVSLR
ncbi:hypothetical protein GCM10010446_35260 [Streptomyces enissocaesilis]|uniref:Uncharacterized protein n=1 Tax=Streptomyces enissocaesilis TaxID=332589 RepID=A0ABP6JTG3_9ACTN